MSFIKRKIIAVFFMSLTLSMISAQDEFKRTLEPAQIDRFKDEIKLKYRYFFESVLNIIDESLDISDRYNSRLLLSESFASTNSTIVDNLDEETPRPYTINKYSWKLFDVENKEAILYKRFKFSDSVSVTKTVKGINTKYLDLQTDERNKKTFDVYKGSVFFLEETIATKSKNSNIKIDNSNRLKEVVFRIIHDDRDQYTVEIESIDIVDEQNSSYNYEEFEREILNSSYSWSDKAAEDYIEKITAEAQSKGILIDFPVNPTEPPEGGPDITDSPEPTPIYDPLKLYDYLVPGLGLTKVGTDRDQRIANKIYWSTIGLGVGGGIYFGSRSRSFYKKANVSQDSVLKREYVTKGNNNNIYSILGYSVAAAGYVANLAHVRIRVLEKKRLFDRATKSNADYGYLEIIGGDKLGLRYTF